MAESKKAKNTTPSTKPTTKNNKKPNWGIIAGIIAAVVIVVVIIIVVICMVNGKKDDQSNADTGNNKTETSLVTETGKGDKIDMKYVSLDGESFSVQVPSNFRKLSASEIASSYDDDELTTVYSDEDNTVNIALSTSDTELKNSDIKEYLDVMEEYMAEYSDVLSAKSFEVDGHTIGSLEILSEGIYNHMTFFSYKGNLAIVTFNCEEDLRDEWEKVGDYIIDSLKFE